MRRIGHKPKKKWIDITIRNKIKYTEFKELLENQAYFAIRGTKITKNEDMYGYKNVQVPNYLKIDRSQKVKNHYKVQKQYTSRVSGNLWLSASSGNHEKWKSF